MAVPGAVTELPDASVRAVERALADLRAADDGARLRTSVLTHVVWAPPEWLGHARETLAGLAERHPSRTILLTPDPDAPGDGLDAGVAVHCFAVGSEAQQQVCAEVIELRLHGATARAPASVVLPLLVSDLPVFLRWRGRPPFGAVELEQLVDVVDRVVVDSGEWPDVPAAYGSLAGYFERAAFSDIAWARTHPWRTALAALWPGIAEISELRVGGPAAEAHLLAGWLRSRLDRDVELVHEPAEELAPVAADGEPVEPVPGAALTPSDLLSAELDRFGRDRVYEQAVRAA